MALSPAERRWGVPNVPASRGAISHVTADEAARVGPLIPQLADPGVSSFGLVVVATIATLTSMD